MSGWGALEMNESVSETSRSAVTQVLEVTIVPRCISARRVLLLIEITTMSLRSKDIGPLLPNKRSSKSCASLCCWSISASATAKSESLFMRATGRTRSLETSVRDMVSEIVMT